MNKVAAFAWRRKNSILSMSEKMFCPPQPLRFWITPAYAGKRRSDWIIRSIYWDHPRVCGEKFSSRSSADLRHGSPPRVRGKGSGKLHCSATMGITPAYAGKRTRPRRWVRPPRDHPRVCGEKSRWSREPGGCGGSPPRVRGKVCGLAALGTAPGITPAYAGKSPAGRADGPALQDHPRVCGEKPLSFLVVPS